MIRKCLNPDPRILAASQILAIAAIIFGGKLLVGLGITSKPAWDPALGFIVSQVVATANGSLAETSLSSLAYLLLPALLFLSPWHSHEIDISVKKAKA
ncbi:hypothetical protein [Amaricoccus macauensis]|uniref:hypothetical protein n=1 Tax=Amaricoccus macauensis TaxID=57001 RepID=UPI003C7CAB86